MDSSYVPLLKSDEKPRAHKIITGGPPALALPLILDIESYDIIRRHYTTRDW